jgi:hypothetical protein
MLILLLCFNQTTIHQSSIILFYFAFYYFDASSQKDSFAQSTTESIIVDGLINEQAWITDSNIATDFIMFEPDNGKPINNKKTEVKVLYDNEAIYISAMLYDNEPNKIQKEITNRDVLVYLIIFQCLWI